MSLKQEIVRELNIPVSIKMGGPGSLNVFVNGRQIFSHQKSGRLPNPQEIVAAIRQLQSPGLPQS